MCTHRKLMLVALSFCCKKMQLNIVLFIAVLYLGIASCHPVSEPFELGDRECPDKKTNCSDTATCCMLKDGKYGCCKLGPKAVCCSDKIHCCREGTTCNSTAGGCMSNFEVFPMEKISDVSTVTCADGSQCANGDTCCRLPGTNSGYGCCPYMAAVCCSDGLHCCPNDYVCQGDGTCTDIFLSIPMLAKVPAKSPKTVKCSDGSQCPTSNTCCKLSSGNWGCCPLPNAVCCSDGLHCCPSDYKCDVSAGTCVKQGKVLPIFTKEPALYTQNEVICPDKNVQCPAANTCCKLSSGGYGCCPMPNAVCCSDGKHCCPEDYVCDVSDGTCIKSDHTIAFFEKISAQKSPSKKFE